MADRHRAQPHQLVHEHRRYDGDVKTLITKKGPSAIQVLAIMVLIPAVGTLLGLACITLLGTLIGLAVTTPLFVIFSPVLVPAIVMVSLAVAGFLSSGAFGLTGLSSFSWVINHFRSKYRSMLYGGKFSQIL